MLAEKKKEIWRSIGLWILGVFGRVILGYPMTLRRLLCQGAVLIRPVSRSLSSKEADKLSGILPTVQTLIVVQSV